MNFTHANIKAISLLIEADTPTDKLQTFITLVNAVEHTNLQAKMAAMSASTSSVQEYLAICEKADEYALEKLTEIYVQYGVDKLSNKQG